MFWGLSQIEGTTNNLFRFKVWGIKLIFIIKKEVPGHPKDHFNRYPDRDLRVVQLCLFGFKEITDMDRGEPAWKYAINNFRQLYKTQFTGWT